MIQNIITISWCDSHHEIVINKMTNFRIEKVIKKWQILELKNDPKYYYYFMMWNMMWNKNEFKKII